MRGRAGAKLVVLTLCALTQEVGRKGRLPARLTILKGTVRSRTEGQNSSCRRGRKGRPARLTLGGEAAVGEGHYRQPARLEHAPHLGKHLQRPGEIIHADCAGRVG